MLSCTDEGAEELAEEAAMEDSLPPFSMFSMAFDSIAFPIVLPASDSMHREELSRREVKHFFKNVYLNPVFGEMRDVPELAEGADESVYYKMGTLPLPHCQPLIVEKIQPDGNYYYVLNYTDDGRYQEALCIAFMIGNEDTHVERTAEFRADNTLIIRQTEYTGGEPGPNAMTRFYEYGEDCVLRPLFSNEKTFSE